MMRMNRVKTAASPAPKKMWQKYLLAHNWHTKGKVRGALCSGVDREGCSNKSWREPHCSMQGPLHFGAIPGSGFAPPT